MDIPRPTFYILQENSTSFGANLAVVGDDANMVPTTIFQKLSKKIKIQFPGNWTKIPFYHWMSILTIGLPFKDPIMYITYVT